MYWVDLMTQPKTNPSREDPQQIVVILEDSKLNHRSKAHNYQNRNSHSFTCDTIYNQDEKFIAVKKKKNIMFGVLKEEKLTAKIKKNLYDLSYSLNI